jgi:hypothetical protein
MKFVVVVTRTARSPMALSACGRDGDAASERGEPDAAAAGTVRRFTPRLPSDISRI